MSSQTLKTNGSSPVDSELADIGKWAGPSASGSTIDGFGYCMTVRSPTAVLEVQNSIHANLSWRSMSKFPIFRSIRFQRWSSWLCAYQLRASLDLGRKALFERSSARSDVHERGR